MKSKILVISTSPWNDVNSSGNTFSNFFEGWENAEFHSLFLREELPKNNVCTSYYQITERQVLMKILRGAEPGRTFSTADIQMLRENKSVKIRQNAEKKLLDFFRTKIRRIAVLAREFLWKVGGWKNKNLNDFLSQNKIDCIFAFAAGPIYFQEIVRYCQSKTGAKLYLFFADDIYTYKSYMPLAYLYKRALRNSIFESVLQAHKLYGISTELCEEYKEYFGKSIEPLQKGCVLEHTKVKTKVSAPIKMVYAGNLYYGRWKILKVLADEIEKINKNGLKITLEIYTTATITSKFNKALNRGVSSKIMGGRPYDEIKKILAESDIVLHVESFNHKEILKTRLSFSTKIIDCLQSGSCLMAIGPDKVSSIKYIKKIDGAIVISDLLDIRRIVKELVENPNQLFERAKLTYSYAQSFHDINSVRQRLQKDFSE